MNDLQYHLAASGGVPLDDVLEAIRRAVARCGDGLMMDDAGSDEVAKELHAMALESPEEQVFA